MRYQRIMTSGGGEKIQVEGEGAQSIRWEGLRVAFMCGQGEEKA